MQTKTCNDCGVTKSLDEFTKAKASANYKTSNQTHHTYCKMCNARRAREWRASRPGYRGSGKISKYPKEDRFLVSAIRQRLADAKARCKKLGKPLPEVSFEDLYKIFITQNRKCALTGADLLVEKDHPLCLSLDQIDPSKGYIPSNVQWVAWCVNRAKGDLTLQHFYEMCETVLEYRKVQRLSKGSIS